MIDSVDDGSPSSLPEYQEIFSTMEQLINQQEKELEILRQEQVQLFQAPKDIITAHFLLMRQTLLREKIVKQHRTLLKLHQEVTLEPRFISLMLNLQTQLCIQLQQLILYQREIQQLIHPLPSSRPTSALIICKQPFPLIVSIGNQLDSHAFTAKLLTGVSFQPTFPMDLKASLLHNNDHLVSMDPPPLFLENNVQHTGISQVVHFPLRFTDSSQQPFPIAIRSTLPYVERTLSNLVCVTRYECQWEGCLGALIMRETFNELGCLPWPQFTNVLQHHFLISTRQDTPTPARALSSRDFQYIRSRFFGNCQTILRSDFKPFWMWFGRVLQTLRFERSTTSLWSDGVIAGLIGRKEAESILQCEKPGTFLVRFSETRPGVLAVAYSAADQVDHRLYV